MSNGYERVKLVHVLVQSEPISFDISHYNWKDSGFLVTGPKSSFMDESNTKIPMLTVRYSSNPADSHNPPFFLILLYSCIFYFLTDYLIYS